MLTSLANRERISERMDDPDMDPIEHRAALAGLRRINSFSRSAQILWPAICGLAKQMPGKTIRLLDIATGSGDVPARLAKLASRAGVPLKIEACDISPTAIEYARENSPGIHYFTHDVFRDSLPSAYDIVTCSLFLHHLSTEDGILILRKMSEATDHLVLINDLERSRLGFVLAWVACRVLTRSPVVRFDGPASVRSAFSAHEAIELAKHAGLSEATVCRHWPCRFLLTWRRP